MIEPQHQEISVVRQCRLLKFPRSSFYFKAKGESAQNLELMRLIDKQYLETPFYGSRRMREHLRRLGHRAGRGKVRRLMRKMGIVAIYQKPRTTIANKDHKKYPYLLRDLLITRPNQV
ncbi:MAG: IS3 family transposase, partial [Hyphomicrobiaceae bacterium]|nr:IS3 family transposase [Hyphomicrobiaceae bacterium]